MQFSYIVATRRRPDQLSAALESAAQALPSDAEIVVVDGDPQRSAREVVDHFRSSHPAVSIRYLASEPGLTRQRNAGIDVAQGQLLLFTDDDCTLEPGLFEVLLQTYADPAVVGVTGLVVEPPPLTRRFGSDTQSRLRWALLGGGSQGTMTSFGFRRPILDVNRRREVEYMPGSFMSARRAVAADVRFDEKLPGYALGEDDDFSFRLSRRGRIRYEPSAIVLHHELGWRHMDHRKRDRDQVVNRAYLFGKNYPSSVRARIGFTILMAMMLGHRVLNREWRGLVGLVEGLIAVGRGQLPGSESPADAGSP